MAAALKRGLGITVVIAVEIATLAAIGLFGGAIVVWAGILTGAL